MASRASPIYKKMLSYPVPGTWRVICQQTTGMEEKGVVRAETQLFPSWDEWTVLDQVECRLPIVSLYKAPTGDVIVEDNVGSFFAIRRGSPIAHIPRPHDANRIVGAVVDVNGHLFPVFCTAKDGRGVLSCEAWDKTIDTDEKSVVSVCESGKYIWVMSMETITAYSRFHMTAVAVKKHACEEVLWLDPTKDGKAMANLVGGNGPLRSLLTVDEEAGKIKATVAMKKNISAIAFPEN